MSQLTGSWGQPDELGGALPVCVGLKSGGFRSKAGTSRMSREVHVRICEGVGVRFPHATRRRVIYKSLRYRSNRGGHSREGKK
jgi:hypothetical protein